MSLARASLAHTASHAAKERLSAVAGISCRVPLAAARYIPTSTVTCGPLASGVPGKKLARQLATSAMLGASNGNGVAGAEEVSFAKLPGVVKTRVGYTGGKRPNPTYDSVCDGDGHTEALRVWYDPAIISYEDLLKMFFREHDPTRKAKCQYKSAVWWHSEEQRAKVQEEVARLEAKFGVKLATTVDPAKEWYDAEEYHQKYIEKSMSRRGAGLW